MVSIRRDLWVATHAPSLCPALTQRSSDRHASPQGHTTVTIIQTSTGSIGISSDQPLEAELVRDALQVALCGETPNAADVSAPFDPSAASTTSQVGVGRS